MEKKKSEINIIAIFVKEYKNIVELSLIVMFITSVIFTFSSNAESETRNMAILNDESIQSTFNIEELRFRDEIVRKFDTLNIKYKKIIDSIRIIAIERDYFEYMILKNIVNANLERHINLPIPDALIKLNFYKPHTVYAHYFLNKERLNTILIGQSDFDKIRDLLKFGDYISKKTSVGSNLRWDFIIVMLIILVLLISSGRILKNIFREKKDDDKVNIKEKIEDSKKDILEIKESNNFIVSYSEKKLNELDEKINSLFRGDSNYVLLKHEAEKAEIKSKEIFQRSTLMLILGLGVSLIGATGFFFALPEFKDEITWEKYIVKSIRPALILIFIQSVSIYLLKQYRMLLEDFKYFRSIYERRANYLVSHQILKNNELSDDKNLKLIDEILKKEDKDSNNKDAKASSESNEDESSSKIIDAVSKVIEKFK